ncbi:unnamed protein product [Orchesella dallaii]|uniref:TIMELESS-interacting protein n=1 Tax=Orchesella dallaii TaxID=48710 RepID=A0ABP1PK95_9HEXA
MSYSDDERNSVRSSSPAPAGLFSDSEHSGDENNEDDRRSRRSGGSPTRDRNTDEEEEEERKEQEAKRKKEEEKRKKQKAKGPVKRTQIHEEMLIGRKGLSTIPEIFSDFQFGGKGREREDLGKILSKLEHWVHLLHPKQQFDQSLERMEFLGLKRKVVKTHIKKIRMGMLNEEIITTDDIVNDQNEDADLEFPTIEGNEMDQDEMRRVMNFQEAGNSGVVAAQSSGVRNDDDGFPDDEDILAAMNEGFVPVTTAGQAKASLQQEEDDSDMDMDVGMGDETVDAFSKDMELALKRAEMAETQMESVKEISSSNSTIDSSVVANAIARAFESSSTAEGMSGPEVLSVPDSECISASDTTAASLADVDTLTLGTLPVVGSSPSQTSPELLDETLVVQSIDKQVSTQSEDHGISLDDLEDADEDEDMG